MCEMIYRFGSGHHNDVPNSVFTFTSMDRDDGYCEYAEMHEVMMMHQ